MLAGGYFACVWALTGDQDYKRDCLQLANVSSGKPCTHCPANTSTCPWYDFRPTAVWASKIYTLLAWLQTEWTKCSIFLTKGVSNMSVYPDWMHDKNLGTDKVVCSLVIRMGVVWLRSNSFFDKYTIR